MSVTPIDHINRFHQSALDQWMGFGQLVADQFEQLARLQIAAGFESTRRVLEAGHALAEVRTAEGLLQWQGAHVHPGIEYATEVSREHFDALLASRDVIAEALRQSAANGTHQIQAGLERLAETAPAGFEAFFDALRGSFQAHLNAMEHAERLGEQVDKLTGASALVSQIAAAQTAATRAPARRKVA